MNKCTGCKQDFTGITTFDAHQSFYKEQGNLRVRCSPPKSLGMVQNDKGQWGSGKTVNISGTTYIPAAERPAHEYDVTCKVCGTIFQRPRKRGRPPTKCEDCRG